GMLAGFMIITLWIVAETRTPYETFLRTDPRAEEYRMDIEQYPSYLPSADLVKRYFTPAGLAELKRHPEKVAVEKGDATVQVTQWQPRHITIDYRAPSPSRLRVRQFYFPGITASFQD